MSWNEERIELLTKLWENGLSASQIATELGGVTRNAVIGKVHRLGLPGRAQAVRPAAPRVRRSRPSAPPRPSTPPRPATQVIGNTALKLDAEAFSRPRPVRAPAPVEELIIPPEERANILSLNERTCKWPIGDPNHEDFYFCGRQSDAGTPYCQHHAKMAYQPARERRPSSSSG